MESPKKQNRPSWNEMVQAAREESPPEINVRPAVRAQLEHEIAFGRKNAAAENSIGIIEGIAEIFAKPIARFTLGASLAATAAIAFVGASGIEISELATESSIESIDEMDASFFQDDWSEYL